MQTTTSLDTHGEISRAEFTTRVLTQVRLFSGQSCAVVKIHQWMWVESIRVAIRVGGVHTGDESGLNPG